MGSRPERTQHDLKKVAPTKEETCPQGFYPHVTVEERAGECPVEEGVDATGDRVATVGRVMEGVEGEDGVEDVVVDLPYTRGGGREA